MNDEVEGRAEWPRGAALACERVEELLVDDWRRSSDARAVEAHLATCAECAATAAAFGQLRGAYRALPEEAGPASVERTVLAAARADLASDGGAASPLRKPLLWLVGSLAAAFAIWLGVRGGAREPEPSRAQFATVKAVLEEASSLAESDPRAALALYEGVFARIDWDAADADLKLSRELRADLEALGYVHGEPAESGGASSPARPGAPLVAAEPTWEELARALEAAAYVHAFELADLDGAVVLIHRLNFDFPQYEGLDRTLMAEARWLALLGENAAALEAIAELQATVPRELEGLRAKLVQGLRAEYGDLGYSDERGDQALRDLSSMGYL